MTAVSTLRRRVVLRLGPLAAVLLLAGTPPWLTGGALAVRLVALPLLLAGLGVGYLAVRLLRSPALVNAGPAAPAGCGRTGGCGPCACGGQGSSP